MERLKSYRQTLRRRRGARYRKRRQRSAAAQGVAAGAARFLAEQFGASRVVVFGSVAAGRPLYATSDVDLAVWGLSPGAYLEAIAQIQDRFPGFHIDMVRMERCPPSLREAIRTEGKEL